MFWENWNYNVGHDGMIEDKFNADLLAFMSPIVKQVECDIVMVYNPSIQNATITLSEKCYKIAEGVYDCLPTNCVNIQETI